MSTLIWSSGTLTLAGLLAAQQTPPVGPVAAPAQQAEPAIVPDDAFAKALPLVGDDINAPLAPLPSAAPTALTPVEPPAAELAQPLLPLQGFDSTPPVDASSAEKGDSVVIRYDTDLRGLEALGLNGQFNGLSALKGGGGKAPNATVVSARAREDEALAVRLMKSLGYYDGTAVSTIEQIPGQTALVRAIVSATPGKQYKIGSITVQAQPTNPAGLIERELPLRIGDPVEAGRVQGAEANVALKLPQQGYPFVTVGQRDVLLDDVTGTADYTLPVDTGPRASFGTFTTEGKLAFGAAHVSVLTRFKPGQLYDNRLTDDLRAALVATGLFSTVSVEPVRTGNINPDGTEQVNLLIEQQAGPPRSLAVTGGYSTGQGIRVEGSFTHRNLFRPEGALIVTAVGGTQEQGASATFRRSNAGRRDKTVTFTASADHSSYDAFNAFTGTLAGRISYDSTPIWQKRLTYAYGVELTGTNESVYDFAVGVRRRGTYFIAALPAQVQFDTSNDLLNPTRGYRLKLSLSPETSVRGAARPYARALVEASGYYPIASDFVLAGRVRAGSIDGISRDELAPSRRYYGGGGGSVRGFGYQELGPRDPDGKPVGGRSVNEAAIELRYRFGNYGIVPFVDAGQSYESSLPTGKDLRFGAGIGGRFYTNFGPLRVDVATPLARRKGESKIALYISIGQAF